MKALSALIAGLLFGLGLALSGMLDPVRVTGFLDVTGAWDPSLAFVLAGAVAVTALGYALCRRLPRPVFGRQFEIPPGRAVDGRLLAGAAVFGIGWGLGGFCPGPGIASLALCLGKSVAFVAAMLLGMALHDLFTRRPSGAVRPATRAA